MLDHSRSVADVLRATASTTPDKVAVVDEQGSLTYAAFDEAVDRLATTLLRNGIVPGDRVASLFWNQREALITYFAAARLGAVIVPLNCRLTSSELSYQLMASQCRAIILDAGLAILADNAISETGNQILRIIAGGSAGSGRIAFSDAISAETAIASFDKVSADAESGIWFTSGTTGRPKGAIVRHRSAVAAGVFSALTLSLSSSVRSLAVAPLFHRGAMENISLGVIVVGGTQFLFNKLTPKRTLELLEQHRISLAFIVPTVAWQMLQEPSAASADLSHLTHWVTASAPLPVATQMALETKLGMKDRIVSWYGITEIVFVASCDRERLREKRTSVGLGAPMTRIAIYDETRGMLPANEVGEIIISGPTSFTRYLNDETATSEALIEIDGATWYRSGDLGTLDEDGYLTIKDRKKDMIISGGENVYTSEVEAVLLAHPSVREGAVIGIPDEKWGEIVVAVVVEQATVPFNQTEIKKAFAQLAGYKRPKHYICFESLPRNSLGKIQREKLRAAVQDYFSQLEKTKTTA